MAWLPPVETIFAICSRKSNSLLYRVVQYRNTLPAGPAENWRIKNPDRASSVFEALLRAGVFEEGYTGCEFRKSP